MERIKRMRKRPPRRAEQTGDDPVGGCEPRTVALASRKTADVLARIDRTLSVSAGASGKAGV